MCLALPVRVVELLDDEMAVVDLGGIRKEISLAVLHGVAVGDYVILHVGYALSRLDPAEAARTLALFAQAGMAAVPPSAAPAHRSAASASPGAPGQAAPAALPASAP
jgi:hydrogenase expression/formation protein HypC